VKAREAINKGEVLYIFDAHNSNVVGVKKARADSASTMPAIAVAYETLALGDEGLAVAFGKANGIIANFTEGETMYVSPTTAGRLTNTRPTSITHLVQNVGILMQAHATNAVVKVTGVGRTNDIPNQFSVGGSITAGSFVKSGGTSSEFLKADGSVDTNTYLITETDPIFTASAASGILAGDITNWNTAYGWGDHSTQGYLTSAPPETDPIFTASQAALITNAGSGDVSQGDTAFSWGDHSVAGYAPATPEVCVVNLATDVPNFTPTGAYTLLQQTGNWASPNPNFNTLTGLYTVASDGVYRISWQVSFRFAGSNLQASRIFVNGSTAAQGPTSSSGAWPIGSSSILLTLS
ncbi:MAG: hypothetical protein VW270_14290, partial [Candidatus Poseidoniales archaeon]